MYFCDFTLVDKISCLFLFLQDFVTEIWESIHAVVHKDNGSLRLLNAFLLKLKS